MPTLTDKDFLTGEPESSVIALKDSDFETDTALTDADFATPSPRVETPDPVLAGAAVSSFPAPRGAPSSLPLDASQHPGDLAFQDKIKADAMAKAQSEGAAKAAGREAAFGVVPTLAGIGAGAASGAATGAGLGALGANPFTVGVGGLVGGLVGGIGAAVGAEWAQGKALGAVAPEKAAQWQAEREAAAQVHPYATMAGSLAPQLIAMKPSLKNVATAAKGAKMLLTGGLTKEVAATPVGKQLINQMFNVGIGAGVQGAQEAYAQYQAGDFNAARLAAQAISGAIVNEPNKFGVRMGLHPSGEAAEVQAAPKPEQPMAEAPDTSKVRQYTPESRAIYEDDVARLNAARAKEGKAAVKMADVWSADIEAADKVADRAGIRMVMVDGMDENGASLRDDPSVVFVSAKSEQPVLTVAAHEIKHSMDEAHPDLAEKLDSVLAEHILERGERPGETHADAFAEALSNPQFWTRLARQDMTLFERLYAVVQKVIEAVSKAIPEQYRVQLKSKDSFFKVQEAAMEAYRGMVQRAADPNYKPSWKAEPFSMTPAEVRARNAEAVVKGPVRAPEVTPEVGGLVSPRERVSFGRQVAPEDVAASERLQQALYDANGREIPPQRTRLEERIAQAESASERDLRTDFVPRLTEKEIAAREAEARFNARQQPKRDTTIETRGIGTTPAVTADRFTLGRTVMPESVSTSERLQNVLFDANGTPIVLPKEAIDAIRKQRSEAVLPREQGQAGEAGRERGGMGRGEQGPEAAGAIEAAPVKPPVKPAGGAAAEVPAEVAAKTISKSKSAEYQKGRGDEFFERGNISDDMDYVAKADEAQSPELSKSSDFYQNRIPKMDDEALRDALSGNISVNVTELAKQPADPSDSVTRLNVAMLYQEAKKRGILKAEIPAIEKYISPKRKPIAPPEPVPTKQQARPDTGKATEATAGVISPESRPLAEVLTPKQRKRAEAEFERRTRGMAKQDGEGKPSALSPAEAVAQGRAVKLPTGTLRVRATYDNGKTATVFVRDLDTLAGSGKITKLEPLQGGDKPVRGEITVKPDSGVKYSERKVTPEDETIAQITKAKNDGFLSQSTFDKVMMLASKATAKHGINIDFEYGGESPVIDFTTDDGKRILLRGGMTNEQISQLNASRDVFRIKGTNGVRYDRASGQPRYFIKLFRGASPSTAFHEFVHVIDKHNGHAKTAEGNLEKRARDITKRHLAGEDVSGEWPIVDSSIKYSSKRYTLENATPEAEQAKAKLDAERETERATFKNRRSFQQLRDWFGSQVVSWEAPIETRLKGKGDLADTVMRAFRAVRGASGRSNERVETAVKTALIDNGIKSKEDVHFLNDVREAQRTIEADEVHRRTVEKAYPMRNDPLWTPADEAAYQKELTFKSPLTVQQARDFLASARRDSRWAGVERANAVIQKQYNDNLAALNKAGIISDNLYKYIIANHKAYQPRVFLDKIDPVRVMDNGRGGKVEVHDSGIRALEQGSDKALISDTVYLLANNIYHTESIIAKNKATMALRDLIRAQPDAIDAKVLSGDEAVPAGYEPIKFRENGKTETIAMNRDLAKHWRLSDPAIDQMTAKLLRTLSGTSTVKFLATAGNPEFAVANVLRDIGLIWLGGRQFSPFLPAAIGQTARNLGAQAMSRQLRRTLKAKYTEYGGSTDYLSTAGHLADLHNPGAYTTGRRLLNRAMHAMGAVGTLSEEANRLSHMQQALRNMGVKVGEAGWEARVTPEQWDKAVYEASNLLDFRQGGKFTKMLDNVIPFINASTQGSRTVARAFRDRPYETAAKAAQLVAIGAYIAWWNRQNNPNAWESMSTNEKNTRLNFTLPASYKDKNGNERHAYIGLPIDQAWRPFMVLGEMMAERNAGKQVDPKRFASVVNANFSPVDLTAMPPVMAAFLTYGQNHNFWKGEDVWKGRAVEPSAERLPSTPEVFKKLGDVTGLSPERMKAAEQTLIPQNPWTSAGSEIVDFFGTPDNEKIRANNLIDAERVPGLRKILRFTSGRQFTRADQTKARKLGVPVAGRSPAAILNESAEKERIANTAKQKNDLQFDTMVGRYKAQQVSRADIMRAIYKIKDAKGKPDLAEMKRIRNRLHTRYPELHFPGGME